MVYDLKSNINSEKNYLIDLRSDTVTKPSAGMRSAMADAEVGDDVYGDDPSINRLEKIVAERLGKESGIFMTSGTQSNLSAILTHCARGEEVIVGNQYHVFIGIIFNDKSTARNQKNIIKHKKSKLRKKFI